MGKNAVGTFGKGNRRGKVVKAALEMQSVTFPLGILVMRSPVSCNACEQQEHTNSPGFILMQENIFCDYVVTTSEDSKHVLSSD